MKLTLHRQTILDFLSDCGETKSAAELHAALPHINLVTIYRALEFFTAAGSIKKVHLAGDEAHFEVQHEPHHHAICTECGKVIHFTTDDAALAAEFQVPGFVVQDLEVTIRGRCSSHTKSLGKK